ncbi:MAG: DUF898 domain-containing protein [Rhodospirillaceae bacterium]|nr:DUF898 domain-containing protein [Rhodospirillaceae bacterium]MBT4488313.1 DUF898 domain-containing protein [Rhodospirillaceae bacterium]MBT5190991.1 DUF898 domain-containing protein [Rhodospirillaceae bacterium]MBT5899341.1 DUF898 domain-containing protein [Rhodospirillaceae bacterium]MBT6430180.1 DUF898 domain-containing protein [Rhodospirillaceae bacterium]
MNDDFSAIARSVPPRLEQRGRAVELLPIVLFNTLLNILTMSIYRFWGKTRVRQYLWRQTHFMDEPLEYTGSGGELFKGFLAVFFLILLPLGTINNLASVYLDPDSTEFIVFNALFYLAIFFLVGMAIYRARRYRLSRTRWRGIRGAMVGSSAQYAIRYLMFWALTLASLGWAYPWMQVGLFKRIMEETRFGDRAFRVTATLGPLYRVFAICWFGALVLGLGIFAAIEYLTTAQLVIEGMVEGAAVPSWISSGIMLVVILPFVLMLWMPWYKAQEFNHLAAGTSFMAVSFRMDVTVWNLTGLTFFNLAILVLTLGFGQPFTQLRTFRYFCRRLQISGELDIDWIQQSNAAAPTMGEGLADAFDLGAV